MQCQITVAIKVTLTLPCGITRVSDGWGQGIIWCTRVPSSIYEKTCLGATVGRKETERITTVECSSFRSKNPSHPNAESVAQSRRQTKTNTYIRRYSYLLYVHQLPHSTIRPFLFPHLSLTQPACPSGVSMFGPRSPTFV